MIGRLFAALVLITLTCLSDRASAQTPASSSATWSAPNASVQPVGEPTHQRHQPHPGLLALPKEALDRLGPEQIYDLARRDAELSARVPTVGINETIIPITFFAMVVAIVAFSLHFAHRTVRQHQETLRLMIERGVPIPPELLSPRSKPSHLKKGLIFVAAGLGIAGALLLAQGVRGAGLGLVPFLVGIAYLLLWKIERSPSDLS